MFLNIDGHSLHVALHGSDHDPALVLLHSLGTSHAVWERQVRAFSPTNFVICPDFRGHGLSEVSRTPVTVEVLAEDVVAMLAALGVTTFHLAGISIGGLVAQCVAATLREQVRTLTLLDSNIVSLAPQMWKDRAAKVRALGLAAIEEAVLSRWTTPQGRQSDEGRGLATMLARTPSEGYAAGCDALAVADCRHSAASLTMPVTVAVGEHDEATPPQAGRALAEAIAGARFEIIDGAAHIPLFERSQAVNALLKRSVTRG
ncbi:alpha/beta fold hydrolase [Rhizobium lentis]|uniref:alpha/beta fold hydrolase n=1 Tax=Rhizobium lentis TaxID=1138194 RepID=UPI001C82C49C|nr:alpha/beta fold hydrolase [Rhizobium lentis]MBX5047393.1 alpha/beta fold hydrolase [Rhizobium lentis]MBX5059877.1 alpha/beta fold hydrolase [Rhizobium lentis]